MIFALGKVEEAFSITPLTDFVTFSPCPLRSFVPVWMMMWLGDPRRSSVSSSIAWLVFQHLSLATLFFGKSFFSSTYLPFESMRSTISGFCAVCLPGGLVVGFVGGGVTWVCVSWLGGGGVSWVCVS